MSSKEYFEFTFEDNRRYKIPKQDFIEISPNLYSKIIKSNDSIIHMPKYIKYNDFDDFNAIYQNYISRLRQFNQEQSFISINLLIKNFRTNIAQLIQISEFFENSSFSKLLIKDCILGKSKEKGNNNISHSLNMNNSITLLNLSYDKLREINYINMSKSKNINIEEDLENTWLELFMKALDIIGLNLDHFFNNKYLKNDFSHNKLWSLDKKIIDEIYEKFSFNLISNNYKVGKNVKKLFDLNSLEKEIDIIDIDYQ